MPKLVEEEERKERQTVAKEWGLEGMEEIFLPAAKELKKRLNNLTHYGFSREEIKDMVRRFPALLSYTAERTNELLANLEAYGFSQEEIKVMVRKLPALLGYSAERNGNLIGWFRAHQIEVNAVQKPFFLIPALKTLEERRELLEKLGWNYQQKPYPLIYSHRDWKKFLERNF